MGSWPLMLLKYFHANFLWEWLSNSEVKHALEEKWVDTLIEEQQNMKLKTMRMRIKWCVNRVSQVTHASESNKSCWSCMWIHRIKRVMNLKCVWIIGIFHMYESYIWIIPTIWYPTDSTFVEQLTLLVIYLWYVSIFVF